MDSLTLPPELSLIGKVAIVTGASRGIGTRIALELAKRGADVALVYQADSSTSLAQHLADEITSLGRKATVIKTDLGELHCGHMVISAALRGLNVDKIDILVNNAGADTPPATSLEFDPSLYEKYALPSCCDSGMEINIIARIMNVNVRAPLLLLQSLLPHVSANGGRVINMFGLPFTLFEYEGPDHAVVHQLSHACRPIILQFMPVRRLPWNA